MQALDEAQTADLESKTAKAQELSTDMAPMMANAEAIMEKCGDDEACLTAEAMKMGAAMSGTPELDAAMKAGKEAQELAKPGARCTRDEVRTGSGEIPVPDSLKGNPGAAAGYSGVEVDSEKGTIVVNLPVPLFLLPYTETITTDEPEGTHDTPTPVGPQQRLMSFRVNAKGSSTNDQPLILDLDGDWHSQSGQQVITLQGQLREAGTLTVRWHFEVQ